MAEGSGTRPTNVVGHCTDDMGAMGDEHEILDASRARRPGTTVLYSRASCSGVEQQFMNLQCYCIVLEYEGLRTVSSAAYRSTTTYLRTKHDYY